MARDPISASKSEAFKSLLSIGSLSRVGLFFELLDEHRQEFQGGIFLRGAAAVPFSMSFSATSSAASFSASVLITFGATRP